jgi:4-hydroxy-tetrahydrodipicolinate synthase
LSKEQRLLEGSIVPLVTPFKNGAIDDAALARMIDRQIDAGSHAISVGGTTGEPAAQTLEEREHVIDLAVRCARGRVPVVPGTGTVNLEETLRLTKFAHKAGVAAALIITPYYVKPNQEGLYRFFGAVAEAVPDLPQIIYNIPGRAGVDVLPATLARLAKSFKNIIGVKQSVKDLDAVSWTLKLCGRDFLVYCGLESLTYPMTALGGRGMIAATANWLPEEMARLYNLARAGKHAEALDLHYFLLEANEAIFWDTNPIPLKTVLSWMGFIQRNGDCRWAPALPKWKPGCAKWQTLTGC